MIDTWFTHQSLANAFFPFPVGLALPFFVVLATWTVAIKGYALWHAARNEQKWWFVFLLLVNLLGIPEVIYLVWFRTDRKALKAVAPAPAPAPVSESKQTVTQEEA